MTDQVNAPDSAPQDAPPHETPAPEGEQDSKGLDYYKAEIRKISTQRDEAKAKLRESEQGSTVQLQNVTKLLELSEQSVAKLKSEARTGEITRTLLRDVPDANQKAVATLYKAGAADFDKPDLSPLEVAKAALDVLKRDAGVLWIDPAISAPVLGSTNNETPEATPEAAPEAPPAKLSGQPAKDDPQDNLRPEVRRAKQNAAFRKRFPGTSGFGL